MGGRYHTPEFRQVLEDYHAEALTAHKGHAKPTMELPTLIPVEVSPDGGIGNGEVPGEPLQADGESAPVPAPSAPPRADAAGSAGPQAEPSSEG